MRFLLLENGLRDFLLPCDYGIDAAIVSLLSGRPKPEIILSERCSLGWLSG